MSRLKFVALGPALALMAFVPALAGANQYGGQKQGSENQQKSSSSSKMGQKSSQALGHSYAIRGKVADVSKVGHTISIQQKDGSRADLKVDDSTRVSVAGKQSDFSSIKQGDEVRATFRLDGNQAVARRVVDVPMKKASSAQGSKSSKSSSRQSSGSTERSSSGSSHK